MYRLKVPQVYPGIEDSQLATKSADSQFMVCTHPHVHILPVALHKGFSPVIYYLIKLDVSCKIPCEPTTPLLQRKIKLKNKPWDGKFSNLDGVEKV